MPQSTGKTASSPLLLVAMAGIAGNPAHRATRMRLDGLAGISQRRVHGVLTPAEQSIREETLNGLINDEGGEAQISTAMRVLAEVIASDAAWLVAVNRAIDGVMESNQKARNNPKALHTLDGYKRGLVNSLRGIFSGLDSRKTSKAESLQEIIDEMGEPETQEMAATKFNLWLMFPHFSAKTFNISSGEASNFNFAPSSM